MSEVRTINTTLIGPNPAEATLPVYTVRERTDRQERRSGRWGKKIDEAELNVEREYWMCMREKKEQKVGAKQRTGMQ